MEPIDDLLEQHELTHGNLCPGALLALRMAVLGCALVGIEDPRGADRNKLVVWVEIDRWLADAVEAVTGARLGKRTLKFLDYGKLAATFLNVETGKAVRIVALESSRRLADLRHPEIEDRYERQMRVYREAAEEELFGVTEVEVQVRAKDLPGHPRSRVICHKCGEGVNDGREISLPDRITLCRPCVYGTYYQPQQKSVHRMWNDQAALVSARGAGDSVVVILGCRPLRGLWSFNRQFLGVPLRSTPGFMPSPTTRAGLNFVDARDDRSQR